MASSKNLLPMSPLLGKREGRGSQCVAIVYINRVTVRLCGSPETNELQLPPFQKTTSCNRDRWGRPKRSWQTHCHTGSFQVLSRSNTTGGSATIRRRATVRDSLLGLQWLIWVFATQERKKEKKKEKERKQGELTTVTDRRSPVYYAALPTYAATHCNKLQHTTTHYNTLQHAVLRCDALQHTAVHCITYSCKTCTCTMRAYLAPTLQQQTFLPPGFCKSLPRGHALVAHIICHGYPWNSILLYGHCDVERSGMSWGVISMKSGFSSKGKKETRWHWRCLCRMTMQRSGKQWETCDTKCSSVFVSSFEKYSQFFFFLALGLESHFICYNPTALGATIPKACRQEIDGSTLLPHFNLNTAHQ